MPNKQKMQNYDYFDILDFKDRSDRDRIAIRPQDRDPLFFGSRSDPKIAIRFISDRDLGVGSRSEKNLDRDRDPIANSNTIFWSLKRGHKRSKKLCQF